MTCFSDLHHPAVRLRPWQRGDVVSLLEAVDASPELARQFGGTAPRTRDEAGTVIEDQLSWQEHRRAWAIEWDGRAVGHVAVSHLDRDHDTGWVSYWVSTAARGRGLATVATTTVTDWVLDHDGLYRLELGHRLNNPGSCRVASAAGFRVEGVEREKLRYGTERFDVELHARLASDPRPSGRRALLIAP